MFDHPEKLLRWLCIALVAVLAYPVVRLATRSQAFEKIPSDSLIQPLIFSTTNQLSGTNAAGVAEGNPSLPPLPTQVSNQVERITQSEILGPVVRPRPVALLGIAGPDAFIRSTSGRTGLLRVGELMDGIKLIQVGTNRVVIEQDGKRRELTIFAGLGSDTLIPKGKDKKP